MRTALIGLEADLRARLAPHLDADPVLRLLCQRFGREPTVPQTMVDDLVARRGPRRTYHTVVQLALLSPDDPEAKAAFADGMAWLGRRDFSSVGDTLPLDPLGQFALAVGSRGIGLAAPWLLDLIRRQPTKPTDGWSTALAQASLCLLGEPLDALRALPADLVAALRGARLLDCGQPGRAAVHDCVKGADSHPPERVALGLGAVGWLRARLDAYLDEDELEEVVRVIAEERLGASVYLNRFLDRVDSTLAITLKRSDVSEHDQLWHVLTGLNGCDDARQLGHFLSALTRTLESRFSVRAHRIEALCDEVSEVIRWQDGR